jgi:hypothetical protein
MLQTPYITALWASTNGPLDATLSELDLSLHIYPLFPCRQKLNAILLLCSRSHHSFRLQKRTCINSMQNFLLRQRSSRTLTFNARIAKSPGLSSPRLAMSAHGAKGSGSGHGGFDPNRFAIRTRKNNEQIVTFVVAMAVITSIVVLAHWLRALISKSSLTWRSPLRPITYSAR